MKHRFRFTCQDPKKLLNGVDKLGTFMSRLSKMAAEQEGNGFGWSADVFKGDGFEAMCEVLINASPIDKRINIVNYSPFQGKDMGIDGVGTDHHGKPVTVQMKFRSDVTSELTTNDHISNFVATTLTSDKFKDAGMVIITTAKGLNRILQEQMYHSKPRVIGHKELRQLVDNNPAFWDHFRKEMGL